MPALMPKAGLRMSVGQQDSLLVHGLLLLGPVHLSQPRTWASALLPPFPAPPSFPPVLNTLNSFTTLPFGGLLIYL